ncbi:MAG: DUF6293 family protein [Halobacteria archaeon]
MQEQVHIIPLGFEISRATAPFEKRRLFAHRAYILTVPPPRGGRESENRRRGEYCIQETIRRLKALTIGVERVDLDLFDLRAVMGTVSGLIRKERADRNSVYVNMSASGRLTSVGATLAGMVHGAQVYYVSAEGYFPNPKEEREFGQSICRSGEVTVLENFKFELPDARAMKVLGKLDGEKKPMSTRDLLGFLREEKVEGFEQEYKKMERGDKINYLMKLSKGILEKLEDAGYVEVKREGKHNRISITEAGRHIAAIGGG